MYNNIIKSGTISVFSRDAQVKLTLNRQPMKTPATRSHISTFSAKSRNNLVKKARNMEGLQGFSTLTYHENWRELTGEDCKRHWSILRKRIARQFPNTFGLWFFEFQERGAPHFHFVTNNLIPEEWLKSAWNDIVDPDNELHREHGAYSQLLIKKHAVGSYVAKYTAKQNQKIVPEGFENVGRFWGLFGMHKRVEKQYIALGNKAFFDLVRTLRKAYRKYVQTYGKYKKHGHGLVGFTAWDCSSTIQTYLEHHYFLRFPEFQGNQSELHLILHQRHMHSFSPHTARMQSLVLDDIL